MKLNDPLCETCPNKIIHLSYKDKDGIDQNKEIPCPNLCLPMAWVNGRSVRKESLLKYPEREEREEIENYNDVLSALIEDRRANHIEKIREIQDISIRAIASMLWADISIVEIAKITKSHRDTLYKKMTLYRNKINGV